MSSGSSSMYGQREFQIQGQTMDFASRHNLEATSLSKLVKGKENPISSGDPEKMDYYLRTRAQEKEIMDLRQQIANASIRGSKVLSEKYDMEKKFSEMRMALDEKQTEVIAASADALAQRKGDLEVNLDLHSKLKAVEDEKYIFTTSMLGILAEFGAWPHVTNASQLCNSIKHLHDKIQFKIKTSHDKLVEVNTAIGNNARSSFTDKEIPNLTPTGSQIHDGSMGIQGHAPNTHYMNEGKYFEPADDISRFVQENDPKQVNSLTHSGEMHQFPNNESLLRTADIDSYVQESVQRSDYQFSDPPVMRGSVGLEVQRSDYQFSDPPIMGDSVGLEDQGPGIEKFQIIGDAKPGCKLLGCGFPVRGTSLCMFQWVRHYPDGTRQYIEGATNPDYYVTADDVDKHISVECIPMDDQGRQGQIVRVFADDNNKITCDDDMREEIDSYISRGLATFNVHILLESSENWEAATLILRRSGFQVKVGRAQESVISEKYSRELSIKIPGGLSAQFVLTSSNGSPYPFSTADDMRMRDALVLTIRNFQSKAVDEKRKSKA